MDQIRTIFFDIGDTLASAHISPAGKLVSLTPLAGVVEALARLREAGFMLGIISNTGTETAKAMRQVLTDAGLHAFFSKNLLIYSSVVGLEKNSPEIFRLACKRAGLEASPQQCLFVGENSSERAFASQAGMEVAASVAAAAQVLLP